MYVFMYVYGYTLVHINKYFGIFTKTVNKVCDFACKEKLSVTCASINM